MSSAPSTVGAVHDLPLGPLDRCQVCGGHELERVLDLGHQPPCDSLLTAAQLREAEARYPLNFTVCTTSGWPRSTTSSRRRCSSSRLPVPQRHHRNAPAEPAHGRDRDRACSVEPGSLVVDIGSNDGTLLLGFTQQGMRVLGVEATNIAKIAIEDGVETVQAFFDEELGARLRDEYGPAKVIAATNMFAHVQNLGDLMRGVTLLLDDGGTFVTESHYLLDLLQTVQYDSIYHEHLKYYSVRPLIKLFETYGFTLNDVDRIPNYGGSIRVYAVKGDAPVSSRVEELLAEEEAAGLYGLDAFRRFGEAARASKRELRGMLSDLGKEGELVRESAAPAGQARCSTTPASIRTRCRTSPSSPRR